jgi:hypothetical protein
MQREAKVKRTVFTAIIAAAIILSSPYAKSSMQKRPSGIPSQTGNSGKYLTTNGSLLSWGTVAAGSGDILADGTVPFTGDVTHNAQKDVRFADSDSTNWAAIQAPAVIASNYTLTLPTDDGAASQVLQTNGSGVLTWANGGVYPTAEASCTALASWTTNTTTTCKYRCVDATHIDITFKSALAGAPNSTSLVFNMPSSPAMTIDRSVSAGSGDWETACGFGISKDTGTKIWMSAGVVGDSGTVIYMYDSAAGGNVTEAVPFTFGSGDVATLNCKALPITTTCI